MHKGLINLGLTRKKLRKLYIIKSIYCEVIDIDKELMQNKQSWTNLAVITTKLAVFIKGQISSGFRAKRLALREKTK